MSRHATPTSFFPDSDVNAFECAAKLSHILSPSDYAFISPTETGFRKSIMDAIIGVRSFLKSKNLHDYVQQGQGPENKVVKTAYFVEPERFVKTKVSLYRPMTKHGDPRIWFSGLGRYASSGNLLMLVTFENTLFVINLSRQDVWDSIAARGIVYGALQKAREQANSVKDELVALLQDISRQGWLKSVTSGDPGVGDTLEHALGLKRNNSRLPDYHGIELKATRLSKNGVPRPSTRHTLFTKTPDDGLNYHEILDTYGKTQIPKKQSTARFQLYETFSTSRVNGYDLYLGCDSHSKKVLMWYSKSRTIGDPHAAFVSSWRYQTLQDAFVKKHPETMWIGAESKTVNGIEYFHYTLAQYTCRPNSAALIDLIEKGIITLDLAVHIDSEGKYRDHGMLWKIAPKNRPLLLGGVENITL